MKSKKQIRHRNKSKKFRKMKGAGGGPSRPRETIQGDVNVNPMQNQGTAAPFLQAREDRLEEERRLQLEEERRIAEGANNLAMEEEEDIDPIILDQIIEANDRNMMNQNVLAGEGLDQDMIDAIAVADNFDAMNEAHQHERAIEAGINTGQRRPEGGGGRVTNQFASGLRTHSNPHVPVRQTKSGQRIPLNPNRSLPTTNERNLDRRDLGFEAEDHNMTIEQYEDYMREQIPGNWRHDYIRLQERRERERLAEQSREQRRREGREEVRPSRQPERNLYQPDSLGTIAYNSLLDMPVDTKEKYETIKQATELPDDYFDFIRGSKSALKKKIRDRNMKQYYKNQPSHRDKWRRVKEYVDARRRELINRYDNDQDTQNTLYYLSENIDVYGIGDLRLDEREGVENLLHERISTNNNLINTPMMANGYGNYNYHTLLMTALEVQQGDDIVFNMNEPDLAQEEVMNEWIEERGRGRGGLINLLIEMGADVNARDDINNTPLHYVAHYRMGDNGRILDVLLNPNNIRNMQNPPYINESLPYNYDLLRQEGADINAVNFEGNTPLHVAIINGNYYFAMDLLRRGARPDIRNIYGETILDIADFFGIRDYVEGMIARLSQSNHGGKRKTKKRKTRRRKTRKH